jgi:DNA-directed RNA polymerase subunit RPC12/RpoP
MRASAMEENGSRRCPRCGGQLRLVNIIPRFGERPEIRIYECAQCDRPQFRTMNGGSGG